MRIKIHYGLLVGTLVLLAIVAVVVKSRLGVVGPTVAEPIRILMADGAVGSLAFDPDGGLLAVSVAREAEVAPGRAGQIAHQVELWDAGRGAPKEVIRGLAALVTSLSFRSGGKVLVAGSRDGVRLWKTDDAGSMAGAAQRRVRTGKLLGVSGDGQLAASTDGADLDVWDLGAGAVHWRIALSEVYRAAGGANVFSAVFSNDERRLGLASFGGVSIWELPPGDRTSKLWGQVKTQPLIVPLAAFSPGGEYLVTAGGDGEVMLWDLQDLEVPGSRIERIGRGPKALACSSDGRLLAIACARPPQEGSGDEIRVWELPSGSFRQRFAGEDDRVTALAFQPGGRTLASGNNDGTVKFWLAPEPTTERSAAPR
jgi:WD40 repeat protein